MDLLDHIGHSDTLALQGGISWLTTQKVSIFGPLQYFWSGSWYLFTIFPNAIGSIHFQDKHDWQHTKYAFDSCSRNYHIQLLQYPIPPAAAARHKNRHMAKIVDFWKILAFWWNLGFFCDCFWICLWFFWISLTHYPIIAPLRESHGLGAQRAWRTKDETGPKGSYLEVEPRRGALTSSFGHKKIFLLSGRSSFVSFAQSFQFFPQSFEHYKMYIYSVY